MKLVDTTEPFKKLLTQGMVLKDGTKMSKSKNNVVDPERIIEISPASIVIGGDETRRGIGHRFKIVIAKRFGKLIRKRCVFRHADNETGCTLGRGLNNHWPLTTIMGLS